MASTTTEDALTSTRTGPRSFAEIEVVPSHGRACRYCNEQATHRMVTVVRPVVRPVAAAGRGKTGTPPKIVDHSQDYCEAHAATLFHKIRQAMK